MTKQIKDLANLKDRQILYEKDLPSFGYMLVLIILGLFFGVFIWSLITPKTYIVKGSGVVESTNKNYIMSSYSGEINEMNVSNGDYVTEDDLLFVIKSTDLNLQEIQLDGKIAIDEKQIAQLRKLDKSIRDDKNYFDENNPDDKQYFNQYETYKVQVSQNTLDIDLYKQYGYTDSQIEVEIKKNEGKISEIYYNTLKTISESINEAKIEVDNLKVQGDAISAGQSDYKITACASGIVHMSTDYKTGMVIQAGTVLGSIAAENEDYLIKILACTVDIFSL